MSLKRILLLLVSILCVVTQASYAQTQDQQTPVEISAVETLEWDRDNKQYIARGSVEVQQGALFLTSDTLTANYIEDENGSTRITTILAQGNVILRDEENTAFGEVGTYDVINGHAKLTGGNLKLVSPDQTITARDSLDYWRFKGEASASGNARVDRGEDVITAQKITAFFAPENTSIQRIEAYNSVMITTPEEVLTGNRGTYNAQDDTASLTGNVKIVRGPNKLEGARAQVNLTTNISKMFGDETISGTTPATERGADGRVRGIFFPGAQEDVPDQTPTAPTPPTAATPPQALPVIQPETTPVKVVPAQQNIQMPEIETPAVETPQSETLQMDTPQIETPQAPSRPAFVRPSAQIEDAAKDAGNAFQTQAEGE